MFNKQELDDGFSDAEFYTLNDPEAILVLNGKEYKNSDRGIIDFAEQARKEGYHQDLIFQIKMPDDKPYNVMLLHIEPTYIGPHNTGLYNETHRVLEEMEGIVLDGKYNKHVRITNRICLFPEEYR